MLLPHGLLLDNPLSCLTASNLCGTIWSQGTTQFGRSARPFGARVQGRRRTEAGRSVCQLRARQARQFTCLRWWRQRRGKHALRWCAARQHAHARLVAFSVPMLQFISQLDLKGCTVDTKSVFVEQTTSNRHAGLRYRTECFPPDQGGRLKGTLATPVKALGNVNPNVLPAWTRSKHAYRGDASCRRRSTRRRCLVSSTAGLCCMKVLVDAYQQRVCVK
ncbi:hypothetical protein JVT61DRAFT_10179 [Boletus reticuloceps]|uniref:Uncharacterized protein n=1 Tax=Boletus reticuloceps TaxID=495285 RepID=A0A8I2YUL1_9AGAM|nr:hypothetical protein JVT61DRAFT_10179 [Boletus reticuloceps]